MINSTNIYVEFRIMGDTFDIDSVTRALSILPTESWQKNDCVYNTQGKIKTTRQYTNWGYRIETINTLDVNAQIEKLEQVFKNKVDTLIELKKQYNLSFSIDIVIIIENNAPPAICFQGFILNFAAALNARIDIDTYIN